MPKPYDEQPDKPLTKAYNNPEFLNSPEARVIRIMAEYLEPVNRFQRHNVGGAVVFFGSARIMNPEKVTKEIRAMERQIAQATGEQRELAQKTLDWLHVQKRMSRYYSEAAELARLLTEWGMKHTVGNVTKRFLVCTGGGPGIMEAANLGAHQAGGESIGLNISLPFEQVPNQFISATLNFEFHYFFMRKLFFMSLANALVIFPGGFGTFDELMEALTLVQTGKVTKNLPVILFGTEFWNEIINLEKMAEFGVISHDDLNLFYRTDDVQDAFEFLTGELAKYHLKED